MTKLTDLKAILNSIPEEKKITSTLIREVADLDFFRKNKPNPIMEKATVKVAFDRVFKELFTVEKELVSKDIETEVKNIFNGCSDNLIELLQEEIGKSKIKKIKHLAIGVVEEDTSFLDEPSEYENFFVFKIQYAPEIEMVKQTDSQVIEGLKSRLGQLRKETK